MEGCRGADIILATGNPPITRKVMSASRIKVYTEIWGRG